MLQLLVRVVWVILRKRRRRECNCDGVKRKIESIPPLQVRVV